MIRCTFLVITLICTLMPIVSVRAQTSSSEVSSPADSGVPIEHVVALIAKKTGKRFLLDPRVRARIQLVGVEPSDLNYAEFLAVLTVYGFIAVDDGKLVEILPDANARQCPTPIIGPGDTRLPDEIVTEVFQLKHTSAAQLVPLLRPMVSQYGHMAALASTNQLMITEHFANLRRMEALVRIMDIPETAKPRPSGAAPESGSEH